MKLSNVLMILTGFVGCFVLLIFLAKQVDRVSQEQIDTGISQALQSEQVAVKELASQGWEYEKTTDDMTSNNVYGATLKSTNFDELDFPYNGETRGYVYLRKHPRHGKDFVFIVDRGQLQCNAYGDCNVTIRFDEKAPIVVSGNPPEDHSSTAIFLPYSRFFRSIKGSSKITIETTFFNQGPRVFKFDSKGLNWTD